MSADIPATRSTAHNMCAGPEAAVGEALVGAVRLGWLMLCQMQLVHAWNDNLALAQEAISSGQVGCHLSVAWKGC